MRLSDILKNGAMSFATLEGEGGTGGSGGGNAPPPAVGAGGDVGAGVGVGGGAGGGGVPWFQGADAEIVGHFQNRGWDKLTPDKAAIEAAKAHREAERLIGVPANKLLRLADPTNEVEYKAMWQRLGVPEDASKYDLSTVKNAKGDPLDPNTIAAMQRAFHAANVPADAAARVAAELVKHGDSVRTEAENVQQAKLAENRAALLKEWGANADSNRFIARTAAEKLGVTPEAIAALENQIGYKDVMQMFLKIGEQMGEAKFVSAGPNGDRRVNSREQATARKAELMADKAWAQRYLDGDAAANREMLYLNSIITGEDPSSYEAA